MYDIIVVGGGPAGMTAALYALRYGKSVLVIEKAGFGGQITHSPRVENYPGTLSMSGNEFAEKMLDQILHQGAEIEFENATEVKKTEDGRNADAACGHFAVRTEEGSLFEAGAVILATGVHHRLLGIPGEEDFTGEGISYCAVCDGDFYAGRKVCVVGGGDAALQEAILLSEKCSEVHVLHRRPYFTAEQKLQDALLSRPNVRTTMEAKVTGFVTADDGSFAGVEIESTSSGAEGERQTVACDGLFVSIGQIPENGPFAELAKLDPKGYFDADERCLTETPGLFIAGDCRRKEVRQLSTAVADGAVAALAACRYLSLQ